MLSVLFNVNENLASVLKLSYLYFILGHMISRIHVK